ncbi:MAG TPA: VWA domain-containing protein [Bacteroidales bacterium]|nr:VWA domain-containing protein [Bacteroidales bacterium]
MYNIEFANPKILYLLLLVVPAIAWYIYRHRMVQAEMQMPGVSQIAGIKKTIRIYLRHIPFIFRMLVFMLLIIALARPQSTNRWQDETVQGIDIMLALDISGSMLAGDFSPNRIEASKDVASEFISGRPSDRIGLVVFGGESFTQCPLTTDHGVLLNLLHQINVGVIDDQSTAIGLGLANAVKRLKDSNAKSRVVILVTDGVNNAGSVDPITAAEIAKTFGVRVYTIGVGTIGTAPFPMVDPWGRTVYQQMEVDIDEPMLRQISAMTNGAYFRATNNQKLKDIYGEIDKLEKSKIDVKQYSRKHEEFGIFAAGALLFLLLEILMRYTVLRSVT